MNLCARGHKNGMFEDIEPDGTVWLTCMFCGDIQATGTKLAISPGSPVMYAARAVAVDPPDYFAEQQTLNGHMNRRYSDEQVDEMVELWRNGTSPADIGDAFGISAKAAYGVLRRNLGDELVKHHIARAKRNG